MPRTPSSAGMTTGWDLQVCNSEWNVLMWRGNSPSSVSKQPLDVVSVVPDIFGDYILDDPCIFFPFNGSV